MSVSLLFSEHKLLLFYDTYKCQIYCKKSMVEWRLYHFRLKLTVHAADSFTFHSKTLCQNRSRCFVGMQAAAAAMRHDSVTIVRIPGLSRVILTFHCFVSQ